jgi:hypothetical protein
MGRRRIVSNNNSAAIGVFLERFFGEHNQVRLDQIERGQGPTGVLLPWINRLKGGSPLATVLPHRFEDGTGAPRYNWYAIAPTERELRDLREDLTAFVGPSWSNFRGERARLNVADPTEAALQEFTEGRAFKFSGNTGKIWESLELMRHVWENRTRRVLEDFRPSGRVLRDFYMALQAGNRDSAESALRYLQEQHGYDAINISFLKVQMLSALERWGELLDSPSVPDILQIRRPVAVTQALIIAVYRRELARFEEQGDAAAAKDYFYRDVLPRYGSLFSARASMSAPEAIKSFMLLAVSTEPPDHSLRDELIALPNPDERERLYLQHLAALLPPAPALSTEDPLDQAIQLVWNGEYDQAFRLAVEGRSSSRRTQILLNCAYELQSLESERVAIAAFNDSSLAERESLISTRSNREFLARISGVDSSATLRSSSAVAEPVPDNWLAWLSRLYTEPSWIRAMEVARLGAAEWDITSLLQKPDGLIQLVQQLSSYPSAAETTLHNCIPFFLEFFRNDDDYPRQECAEVYDVLLDVLTISTNGGDDDLTIFNELVMARLWLGMDAPKYTEVLRNAEDLWGRYASPSKVDWILDLLDSLILYPSPAEEKRNSLLNFAATKFTQFARRVDGLQWEFLALLASDLHQESLLPLIEEYRPATEQTSEVAVDALTRLAGKSITIYTMTEAVAQRVKGIIQSTCASAAVHLCHDKVGSERLRQLARGSDIFIMATASAKHAATGFIEAHRPETLPLLRPSGKGSASMLRALRSHLEA